MGGLIQAIMTGGEDAGLSYLTVQVPIFSNPILNSFAKDVLSWIVEPIQTYLINSATMIVINIQTTSEQSNIITAATALQIAQQSGDQNAIKEALAKAKDAYQSLLQWNGTYNAP